MDGVVSIGRRGNGWDGGAGGDDVISIEREEQMNLWNCDR